MAQRDHLNLCGAAVEIELTETHEPYPQVDTISVAFRVPRDIAFTDRLKMEGAAELCPIKHSFGKDAVVTATF